jgi:hypothetical protein
MRFPREIDDAHDVAKEGGKETKDRRFCLVNRVLCEDTRMYLYINLRTLYRSTPLEPQHLVTHCSASAVMSASSKRLVYRFRLAWLITVNLKTRPEQPNSGLACWNLSKSHPGFGKSTKNKCRDL